MEKPTNKVMSFVEWAEEYYGYNVVGLSEDIDLDGNHKYGYILVDARNEVTKIVKRTNPNKRWDWWVLGGRWTGTLVSKNSADSKIGKPGLMTPPAESGTCDTCRVSDLDFDGIRENNKRQAQESWNECKEKYPKEFNDDGTPKSGLLSLWGLKEGQTEEDYVNEAYNGTAFSTFAILEDGKWLERGEMGQWGHVSNETDANEWNQTYKSWLEYLIDKKPHHYISIVDCHI